MRILLVDDTEAVRRGIRSLLTLRTDWLICGEAVDGLEALEKARSLRPDIVLMDLTMPDGGGRAAPFLIHAECSKETQLKELCFRVEQQVETLSRCQTLLRVLRLNGFGPTAFANLGFLLADAGNQRHHARRVAASAGAIGVEFGRQGSVQLRVWSAHSKLVSIAFSRGKWIGCGLRRWPVFRLL